jgi:putative ABC transport system permease protein
MNFLVQICALTGLGLRTIPKRLGASSIVVVGVAAVVAVTLSMLTLVDSLGTTLANGSRPDRAIVLSTNSELETDSVIRRPELGLITTAPGIAKDAKGEPIASIELLGRVRLRERDTNRRSVASVRGVSPTAFALRPEITWLAGRPMQPGLHELVVGSQLHNRYLGLEIGDVVAVRDHPWKVVGIFSAGGGARESEVLADTETLAAAYNKNAFQSVLVKLDSPDALAQLRARLTSDASLRLEVTPESTYAERESASITRLLRIVAYLAGAVMAAAAVFGATTMMYAAVSDRTREITTLRALGFSSSAVVISVLLEVTVLAIVGAAIASVVVALILNGREFHSSYVNVQLHLSATLMLVGLGVACLIGLLSGVFPALQIAGARISTALYAV